MVQPFWKTVWWSFFKRLNIQLPYDPAILLPRKMKNRFHTKSCTSVFMVALFIIAQKWKIHSNVHKTMNRWIKCEYPCNRILFHNKKKRVKDWSMLQNGWTLKTLRTWKYNRLLWGCECPHWWAPGLPPSSLPRKAWLDHGLLEPLARGPVSTTTTLGRVVIASSRVPLGPED